MFSRASLLLSLAATLTNADAFVSPATYSRNSALNGLDSDAASSILKKARIVKSLSDLVGKDKDGNEVRVPVKGIERDWSVDDFTADGEFSVDLFLPEDRNEIKGCAFFMHGFSQYPVAYRQTLTEACDSASIAIIAVETGITDGFVWNNTKGKTELNFNLQRALSEDTKQCIRMIMEGDNAFAEYGVTRGAVGNNIAVIGHGLGGGLSFPVAADCNIDYVFSMAPIFGKQQFNPIVGGVDKRTPKSSMLLAGEWDLLAPANKVEEISAAANSKKKESSIYVDIARGLHTGFQDEIVAFNVKVTSIFDGAGLVGKLLGIADFGLFRLVNKVRKVVQFGRTKTGQIDGSGALMNYFLCAMVTGENTSPEAAEKYLDDNIEGIFQNKFDIKYGGNEKN
eukprot:CAMPEP_0185728384 /NCGR_PEP_ID=MMETSP1171-20130828/3744_1 /TAXON_ID=374046 /ORGANISM="Helicotheca tamensis, Strain CCMP826" /LENGTH=395 /DNA_ID=CAMNT_0028397091 /DNA_START=33 /DNA_END=1220 /DNA_ORIENTATION=-